MQTSSVLSLNTLVQLYFRGEKEMWQDDGREGPGLPLDWAKDILRPQHREMGKVGNA